MPAVKPHPPKETGVLIVQGPRTGATLEAPGMPGTTPYTEDSALANAFSATTAVHFHSIVALVAYDTAAHLLDAWHVVVIVGVVVVVVRTEDTVRALCLRLDFGLQQIRCNAISSRKLNTVADGTSRTLGSEDAFNGKSFEAEKWWFNSQAARLQDSTCRRLGMSVNKDSVCLSFLLEHSSCYIKLQPSQLQNQGPFQVRQFIADEWYSLYAPTQTPSMFSQASSSLSSGYLHIDGIPVARVESVTF